jgi:polyhydroxyalkanoate synthesis repressor PhaR
MTDATPRVIKRYANRKLYDTRDSRYVTLDQISEMIRLGEDVKVVDNSTKADLTSVTLAQIIFEEEKRKRSFLPLSALRKIVQSGGESFHDLVNQLSESAERMGRVFRREDGSKEEAINVVESKGAQENSTASVADPATGARTDPTKVIREFVDGVQDTMDNWQKKLDLSINSAIESISPLAPLQKEIQQLHERLAELEQKLGGLEKDQAHER